MVLPLSGGIADVEEDVKNTHKLIVLCKQLVRVFTEFRKEDPAIRLSSANLFQNKYKRKIFPKTENWQLITHLKSPLARLSSKPVVSIMFIQQQMP